MINFELLDRLKSINIDNNFNVLKKYDEEKRELELAEETKKKYSSVYYMFNNQKKMKKSEDIINEIADVYIILYQIDKKTEKYEKEFLKKISELNEQEYCLFENSVNYKVARSLNRIFKGYYDNY